MPPLNLPWIFLGRPVKPVAFGFTVLMLTLMIANIYDNGVMGTSRWGDAVAVAAAMSWLSLTAGWWLRSQHLIEIGLVIAAGVYMARASYIALVYGVSDESLWLALGAASIAAGSYLLEKVDLNRYNRSIARLYDRLGE